MNSIKRRIFSLALGMCIAATTVMSGAVFAPEPFGGEATVAFAAPAKPSNVKISFSRKDDKNAKVKLSWSGSTPYYFYNLYWDENENYGVSGYERFSTSKKSATFTIPMYEGVPYIFHLQIWGYTRSGGKEVYSKVVTKSKKYQLVGKQTKKFKKIIADNVSSDMTAFDKVRWAHDYLIKNYSYDDDDNAASHHLSTCFGTGKAVCQGYAEMYGTMLKLMGIETRYVSNNVHGWNLVKLDKKWYHVDVTFDDPTGTLSHYTDEHPIYDYFLQSTEAWKNKASGSGKHKFNASNYPKATSTIYDNPGKTPGYSTEFEWEENVMTDSVFSPWKDGAPVE